MKTLIIIYFMIAFVSVKGYSQEANIQALLDKPETRAEIFNAILESNELRAEFMQNMKASGHAMAMKDESKMKHADCKMKMQDDHQMMKGSGTMMQNDHQMMKGDGAMMQNSSGEKMMNKNCSMSKMHKQESSGQKEQENNKQKN